MDKRKYFTKDIEIIKDISKDIDLEESAVTIEEVDYNVVKSKDNSDDKVSIDVFVPDESLFTKGTLRSFKKTLKILILKISIWKKLLMMLL